MADNDLINLDEVNLDDYDVVYNEQGEVALFESFCNLFARELTAVEFEYLLSRYRFIDLAKDRTSALLPPKLDELQRYRAQTGWWICDYGDRLLASPGRLTFGNYKSDGSDEDGGEGDVGIGSLTQQGIETMQQLFMLITSRWNGVYVVDGYSALQRMAWIFGMDAGLAVDGFEPNYQDIVLRENIMFLRGGEPKDLLESTFTGNSSAPSAFR